VLGTPICPLPSPLDAQLREHQPGRGRFGKYPHGGYIHNVNTAERAQRGRRVLGSARGREVFARAWESQRVGSARSHRVVSLARRQEAKLVQVRQVWQHDALSSDRKVAGVAWGPRGATKPLLVAKQSTDLRRSQLDVALSVWRRMASVQREWRAVVATEDATKVAHLLGQIGPAAVHVQRNGPVHERRGTKSRTVRKAEESHRRMRSPGLRRQGVKGCFDPLSIFLPPFIRF
jgi:hypothetical protein